MAYDERTNREAVRVYSHAGVSEYIPRSRVTKPSLVLRIKRFLGLR